MDLYSTVVETRRKGNERIRSNFYNFAAVFISDPSEMAEFY